MSKRHVSLAPAMLSVTTASLLFFVPNIALGEDLESTTDVAKVEAATKYSAD